MNILVTSAGRRVKIIEYFRKSFSQLDGKVIATDCDSSAPAIYFADDYEIVPRIDDENYISVLLKICEKHEVSALISLIDPELEILAKSRELFERNGVSLILSPVNYLDMSFDKYDTYHHLNEKEIQVVPTYNDLGAVMKLIHNNEMSFPLVVKPAKGSASLGLFIVENESELHEAYHKSEGQIIQPFYKDKEFGVDVYIDLINGKLVDLFIKEKIRMRAGETDKSISIHNQQIEELVKDMVNKTNFRGPIDVDCFEYEGNYYISEVNPRFGGGYPHAYEMGCNFMDYIISNLRGEVNQIYSGYKYKKDFVMMKYDNLKLIKK